MVRHIVSIIEVSEEQALNKINVIEPNEYNIQGNGYLVTHSDDTVCWVPLDAIPDSVVAQIESCISELSDNAG